MLYAVHSVMGIYIMLLMMIMMMMTAIANILSIYYLADTALNTVFIIQSNPPKP